MFSRIQAHLKKKRVQARAAQPKPVVTVNIADIQQKLSQYSPQQEKKRATFVGPSLKEFESAL